MHNDHYKRLEPHEPIEVFKTWATANYIVLCANPTLSGYYLAILKYLARLELKQSDSPLKNLQKARFYIDRMIDALEQKERQIEEILSVVNEYQPSSDRHQLNPYSPNKKPEVERWIKWSTTSFGNLPRRCVRKKDDTYRLIHDDKEGVVVWYWHEFADWGNWHYIDEPIKQEPEQTNEWHDYSPDVQPEKGRWIEWSKERYKDEEFDKPATLFREDVGNYTSYFWKYSCKSHAIGYWNWGVMSGWGQWRYVDAPS